MRRIGGPVEDPHTVLINGKTVWFANLEFAKQERLVEIDRQIRHLTTERARVAAELRLLRGAQVYASITANHSQLHEGAAE